MVNRLFYTSTRDDQLKADHLSQVSEASDQSKRILILGEDNEVCRQVRQILDSPAFTLQCINDVQSFIAMTALDDGFSHQTETADRVLEWAACEAVVICGGEAYARAGRSYHQWRNDVDDTFIPVVLVSQSGLIENLIQKTGLIPDAIVTQPVHPYVLTAQVASMLRIKREHDILRGAIRLREDLTNMIAHDLRTPLTVITMYSAGVHRLLKQLHNEIDAPTVSRIQERIQIITDNVNSMEALIADMLTIARTESNNLTLRHSWVNINDLVVTACHPQREIAHAKNVDMRITLLEDDIEVQMDRDLMRRVLDNLLSNAIKFSPEQSRIDVLVSYATSSEGVACDCIRVSIRDQGPGIEQAFQEHIFNRWGIAELKRKGVAQIGLGLAFCKMVVEAHRGQIVVDSAPGAGSTFCFTLPL